MDVKELNALITLLEDPDKAVFNVISVNIINQGVTVVHLLEKAWATSSSELVQQRIESIIHSIQFNGTMENFQKWVSSGAQDLLEGAFYLSLYQYPDTEYATIEKAIEKIKKDVWLELNENLTALEKVKILNHIIYDIHGFTSNTSNFFAPQNQFINQVLETKKGGPVALAILYSTIAQRLGLPIYTVNLPKNFILAYKDRFKATQTDDPKDSILFYINPFNKGSLLGRVEIDLFLNHQNIELKDEFYLPCSNRVTIAQLISSLTYSFEKLGDREKLHDLSLMMKIVA
jgi:regulator of sirC expression with transglutaminase-like and TPR domain